MVSALPMNPDTLFGDCRVKPAVTRQPFLATMTVRSFVAIVVLAVDTSIQCVIVGRIVIGNVPNGVFILVTAKRSSRRYAIVVVAATASFWSHHNSLGFRHSFPAPSSSSSKDSPLEPPAVVTALSFVAIVDLAVDTSARCIIVGRIVCHREKKPHKRCHYCCCYCWYPNCCCSAISSSMLHCLLSQISSTAGQIRLQSTRRTVAREPIVVILTWPVRSASSTCWISLSFLWQHWAAQPTKHFPDFLSSFPSCRPFSFGLVPSALLAMTVLLLMVMVASNHKYTLIIVHSLQIWNPSMRQRALEKQAMGSSNVDSIKREHRKLWGFNLVQALPWTWKKSLWWHNCLR